MNINIYGSTGVIGVKSLKIIKQNFPKLKINLLVANNNINLLIKQTYEFKPKYIYINNKNKINFLKLKISNKIKILKTFTELLKYLSNSNSNFSILAISGYQSLNYLDQIISNTDNLGAPFICSFKPSVASLGLALINKL